MKKRKYFLRGAVVLLIAIAMVFSTIAIADTQIKQNQINLNKIDNDSIEGARGDIVWDNDMSYDSMHIAQYDSSIPLDSYPADDFHFTEDTEVSDVHWVLKMDERKALESWFRSSCGNVAVTMNVSFLSPKTIIHFSYSVPFAV